MMLGMATTSPAVALDNRGPQTQIEAGGWTLGKFFETIPFLKQKSVLPCLDGQKVGRAQQEPARARRERGEKQQHGCVQDPPRATWRAEPRAADNFLIFSARNPLKRLDSEK
jgi:hypothetical protein